MLPTVEKAAPPTGPTWADCVVVGFDGSRSSGRAREAAADAAQRRGVTLVVLTMTTAPQSWDDDQTDMYQRRDLGTDRGHVSTASAAGRLSDDHPQLPVRVVRVDYASSDVLRRLGHEARLLVLGQRSSKGQRSLSMGSQSEAVVRAFSCPVLIVHDGYVRPRSAKSNEAGATPCARVVAGIDGQSDSAAVITVAWREAEVRRQPLVIVHSSSGGHGEDHLSANCRSALRAARERLGSGSVPHTLVMSDEEPVPALVRQGTPGDLIVVGNRGAGRLSGLVAGSTSWAILGAAPCDVLVVQGLRDSSARPHLRTGTPTRVPRSA